MMFKANQYANSVIKLLRKACYSNNKKTEQLPLLCFFVLSSKKKMKHAYTYVIFYTLFFNIIIE